MGQAHCGVCRTSQLGWLGSRQRWGPEAGARVEQKQGRSRSVVVGVDIGTTSTKSVAFDARGSLHSHAEVGYPLSEPRPGYAEQDPATILDAVVATVRRVVTDCGCTVRALSFSSAM